MSQQSTDFGYERRAEFGRYLEGLRKHQRLTQKKAAEQLGISPGRLSYIESGNRPVPDELLVRLAEEYHVPLEEILRRKYWPQLPLLTGIMHPDELLTDLQKDLHPEEIEELKRYMAFLLLRRATVNRT